MAIHRPPPSIWNAPMIRRHLLGVLATAVESADEHLH